MNKIIFTAKGNISKEDKALLRKEKVLVIECEDPEGLKTFSDLSVLGADEIAVTAIEVLNGYNTGSSVPGRFGEALLAKAVLKINQKPVNSKP